MTTCNRTIWPVGSRHSSSMVPPTWTVPARPSAASFHGIGPESAQSILRGMPADQIARLQNQAHNLGAAELSRAADVTNTALTEMTGATSPRLHLELLCARILLPSSEQNERGIAARIDRVERRLNYGGNDVGAPAGVPGHQGLRPPR